MAGKIAQKTRRFHMSFSLSELIQEYYIFLMLEVVVEVEFLFTVFLQLPRISHHQVKIGIVIDRSTDAGIVVHKFIESNLDTNKLKRKDLTREN